ncbi:MarR family winged helix-turn-helix transcriptional regulator [Minwuia sp.]|uniref:MarR family winged helix-turn-helix transcriptional regulator n=1 Tax=Minwuia sp. TaxID=2493630 RepID=UPI003A8F7779
MADDQRTSDLGAIYTQRPIGDTFRISFMANSLVLPVYEQIKRRHGLNRGEYLLIHSLSIVPEMTAQEVARMSGRPRNSISRAVHRMVEGGYVRRVPDPDDGRQATLTITDSGRNLVREILPLFEARQEQLLGVLNVGERRQLDALLDKLYSATLASAHAP